MRERLTAGIELGLAFGIALYVAYWSGSAARYVAFGLKTGDWLNDWLCHLPRVVEVVVAGLTR